MVAIPWRPTNRSGSIQSAEDAARIMGEDKGLGFLYRFSDINEIDEYERSSVRIMLEAFTIRTHSKSGWTIAAKNGNGWRFIGENAHRKFAAPAIALAIISFRMRKKRQAAIYDARAERAREAAKLISGLDLLEGS